MKLENADHRRPKLSLQGRNGRVPRFRGHALLSVKRNDNPRDLGASRADERRRLPHGGSRRKNVVDQHHSARDIRPYENAPFPMGLGLFPVECPTNVTATGGKRFRRGDRNGNALVGGAKHHVEGHVKPANTFRVGSAQPGDGRARIEGPEVEEVRAPSAGLQGEVAESQNTLTD